jgi:hypothetical protein
MGLCRKHAWLRDDPEEILVDGLEILVPTYNVDVISYLMGVT